MQQFIGYPKARILVFAKAPVPGQVKTRLIPALGADRATALYRKLLESTIERISTACLAPVVCWCSPHTDDPFFRMLLAEYALTLETQSGADLGERMAHATRSTLRHSGPVVLIGGDCPALSAIHLRQTLDWLDDGYDAVLGPADDGGYVLLGLRRYSSELFTAIPWGGESVLQITRRRLAKLRWHWQELETLWDVDRPLDLERLAELDAGEWG